MVVMLLISHVVIYKTEEVSWLENIPSDVYQRLCCWNITDSEGLLF